MINKAACTIFDLQFIILFLSKVDLAAKTIAQNLLIPLILI